MTTHTTANPWHNRAPELARWAFGRYFIRHDRYGGYWFDKGKARPYTKPAKAASPNCVTTELLERHFRAATSHDVIGAHTINTDGVGLYLGADVDAHPGAKADPVQNERFALSIDAELRSIGLKPLTSESNGKGGYHVVAFFSAPVKGITLFRIARWLLRKYADFGFAKAPEAFPKQSSTDKFGNWLRVIGRHHTRDFWPRVWNGAAWLEGASAVEHVLTFNGGDPDLLDPFRRFNRASTVDSMGSFLERHGWHFAGQRGERRDYRRPGKKPEDGQSGNVMLFDGVPIFYPFTNATELEQNKGLSPCQLRARLEYRDDFAALAEQLWTEFLGSPLGSRAAPSRNGTHHTDPASEHFRKPDPEHVDPSTDSETDSETDKPTDPQPQTGVEVILSYYRERYKPIFRQGNIVVCQNGEDVSMNVACSVPTSALIAQLESAIDAPRYAGRPGEPGDVKKSSLPAFFNTWAKVAWGDLLESLPDEDTAELGTDEPVADVFRRMVRDAMLTEVVLGETIGKEHEVTQTQRCSLIDWCVKLAKDGPWKTIRSKKCWCKTIPGTASGEIILKVAIQQGLFSQLKSDRYLTKLTENTFARRATKYGVGTSTRKDRPQGASAVVLSDEFVAELTANLVEEKTPEGADKTDAPCDGEHAERGFDV